MPDIQMDQANYTLDTHGTGNRHHKIQAVYLFAAKKSNFTHSLTDGRTDRQS